MDGNVLSLFFPCCVYGIRCTVARFVVARAPQEEGVGRGIQPSGQETKRLRHHGALVPSHGEREKAFA